MSRVQVSTHPLVRHKLSQLRDVRTGVPEFRALVRDLSRLLFYEALADARTLPRELQTPLATIQGEYLWERIALIPILRAGLGMADAIAELLPTAVIWHLGVYRDHDTLQPVTYYNKLPSALDLDRAIVLDPMLATGGSALACMTVLKRAGVTRISFIGLIAAPEGVRAMQAAHPDVELYLAAIDSHLNEKGYIVPGLGDAGDRQYGT
ncbi:MAG: uracil phosphoribosyltransferase [Gemmataceae bacterium]